MHVAQRTASSTRSDVRAWRRGRAVVGVALAALGLVIAGAPAASAEPSGQHITRFAADVTVAADGVARVVLDLDAATAAGMLGISPTNCSTRLNRALEKLQEALNVAA